MKKVACVVFELDENEKVEDVIARIEKVIGGDNACDIHLMTNAEVGWRNQLSTMLKRLGEGVSTMGYSILFDIMECVDKEPKYRKHFRVNELYGYITEKTGKPYCQIERNIRAMIDRIYNNNPTEYVHSVLGIADDSYTKMTNSKFLALLIEKLF